MLEGTAFDGSQFMKFMRILHNKCKQPFAILLDNAGMHKKDDALEKYCDKFDITLIWNVPYRADFNGIEAVWKVAKEKYRQRLDWHKANNVTWD